jgi:hypothetical protein
MAEIKQVNGHTIIDYMARDYDSLLQSMRELVPYKLPEWKDFESEADFGNVLLQLFAHMGDILSYYQDQVANESFLGTAQSRRSIIQHLRLIGYKLATAAPASTALTLIVPSTATKTITIKRGDAFATKSQKNKPSVRFEYTGESPLTIDCATLPIDPIINKKYYGLSTNPDIPQINAGIPVEEGRLVQNEALGISDGTRNQRFPLAHSGLILRSRIQSKQVNKDIILITDFAGSIDNWVLQESLAFSREGQKDFTIEIDEEDRVTIIFGDGTFGAIPTKGALIKVTYRVGGGLVGNVAADTIQTIVNAPELALLGAIVTNRRMPATGGADRESIEHAVQHAPSVFRSLKRAVTAEDYKALALDFKGVGKVRAKNVNWNTVTLFVAPEGGGLVSDVLEANLLSYFEDKRPLSTIIEIQDVKYVQIYVTAEVGIKSYYSREDISTKVGAAAGKVLAFDNVDFGQTLYLSQFYEVIEAIEGVQFVNITEFRREDQLPDPSDPLVHVARSGKLTLDVSELPQKPADPQYAEGIKVLIVEGGY